MRGVEVLKKAILLLAAVYECPSCETENFVRLAHNEQAEMDRPEEYTAIMALPRTVKCRHCGEVLAVVDGEFQGNQE